MTSPDRIDSLNRGLTRLKVAHERLRGEVRQLGALVPVSDGHLREDIDDLREVIKELRGEVEALQRWRWQVIGAAGGVGLVAAPLGQVLLHALGVH
ncbi:MAG: hypothetical protein AUG44_03450 [Actinobacteria bacterium 13_1_20CM_3_71_11]|nr:MAG: hypothetical protein AUG44_03450 [Actinobacteria bacterium 13_1_20CM_3_71_11]